MNYTYLFFVLLSIIAIAQLAKGIHSGIIANYLYNLHNINSNIKKIYNLEKEQIDKNENK